MAIRKSQITRSLTRYVVFSISCLVIYTITALIFLWLEKPLDEALTTGVFGFFGGEIVMCGLIKLFKIKKEEYTMDKLTSRKFWICVAAFLGSIATSISGIVTENQTIIIIGTVCGIASAAIYAFCEAWVDSKAVEIKETE